MLNISYTLSSQPNVEDVLASEFCSYWLKSMVTRALEIDPLKAIRDVEVLHAILHARLQKLGIK